MKRSFRFVDFWFHRFLYMYVSAITLVVWELKKDPSHSELIETYLTAESEGKSWQPSSLWSNNCEYKIKLYLFCLLTDILPTEKKIQVHPICPLPSCLNLHNADTVTRSLLQHSFPGTGFSLLLRILCFDAAA